LGQYDVQLRLHPTGCISIEGRLEFYASDGALLEAGSPRNTVRFDHLGSLVGTTVSSGSISPPSSISFEFSSGHRLRLINDPQSYESFSLEPGSFVV
jgi:hypothetical protein